jgi:hypothetical protein
MNTVDTIERDQERRRRYAAYLILTAALILILGLVGRSLLGGTDGATAQAPNEVEVLSGVMQHAGASATPANGNQQTLGTPGQGQAQKNPGVGQGNPGQGNQGGFTPGQGQPTTPGTGQPAPPGQTPQNPRTFDISGDLDEIYPTFDGDLTLTFTNPHRFEIVVTELDVAIAPPAGSCADVLPSGVFAIGDLPSGGVEVAKRSGNTSGTATTDLSLTVSNALPDECEAVSFEITYSGSAIRANQS